MINLRICGEIFGNLYKQDREYFINCLDTYV